jgi:glycosyltransferase 2 family protein
VTYRSGKLLGNLARMALSLIALAVLFRQVGGGGVFIALSQARIDVLVLALVLFLIGDVVRAFRWRTLLHGLGIRPPFGRLLKLYLVGNFFNAFLPSGFGGDAVRVLELSRGSKDAIPGAGSAPGVAALGTVFVDRLAGILSLLALGVVMLPFAQGLPPAVAWLFAAVALTGLAAGALLLEGASLRRLTARLPGTLSLVGSGKPAQIYAAVTGSGPRALWTALALSTLFNLLNITVYWLSARAVGIDLDLSFYFVFVPLLSLSLLLPISVGGLGARDWLAQLLLAPTGVAGAMIAAWTLSVWVVGAAGGFVGGVVYLWEGVSGILEGRRHAAAAGGTGAREE